MLRLRIEYRETAIIDSSHHDRYTLLSEAIDQIRTLVPISLRREQFIKNLEEALRIQPLPIRVQNGEMRLKVHIPR